MKKIVLFALLALTASMRAQDVTVGSFYATEGSSYSVAEPLTMVNLSAPATGPGVINYVTVTWRLTNGVVCPNAFRIRFFRRAADSNVYTAYATRGPFPGKTGQILLSMSPPVTVSAGDVIGVVQAAGGVCGTVVTAQGGKSLQTAYVKGESETFDLRSATWLESAVNVRGSTSGRIYEGSIAAAGSLAGANGSFFRTSLHLTNLNATTPATGEVVFRAAGQAPSPGDPKIAFYVGPKSVVSWTDIVAALGQSGLGSIDIFSTAAFPPSVTARVFDDKGPLGTSGFTEDFIPPTKALRGTAALALTFGEYRTNIGLRAIGGVSKVRLTLYSEQGQLLNFQERDLAADVFAQTPLTSLFGSASAKGAHVGVSLLSGAPVIAYASTTDNRTNDSSIQFAKSTGD
jgi:hypothetical protein